MREIVLTALAIGSAVLLLSGVGAGADECPITVFAYDGGHYDSDGHIYADYQHNYSAGRYANLEFRNYFTFHLPPLTQAVARAELQIIVYYVDTPDAFETYELHHVSTPITELTNRIGLPRVAIFNDLGDGPAYGSFNVSTNALWTTITIPLNSAAMSDLAAASGADFALGGRVTTLSGVTGGTELIFDYSYGPPNYTVSLSIFPDPPLPPQATAIYGGGSFPAGTNVLLMAETCGRGPISFQWQHEGTNLLGATNSQLMLTNVQLADAGKYCVLLTDPYGSSTNCVVTLFIDPLRINRNPISSQYVLADDPFTLNVDVTSLYYPVFYQWFRTPNTLLTGETNAVYGKQSAAMSDSGSYYVIVSNDLGSVTSLVATITVQEYGPSLSIYFESNSVPEGASVTLKTVAYGAPRPVLQWFFNDVAVPGANGPELTFVNVTTNEAGIYRLVATNRLGSVSNLIILNLTPAGPLDKWRLRNPFPQPNDLHDIIFANGRFVAVGENGAIVTSANGVDWVLQNSKTDQALWGVTFANDRFVAVGPSIAVVSTNGTDWRSTFPGDFTLRGVTFGAGKFVAIGNFSGYAVVSSDGFQWQPVALPQQTSFSHITYANGLFVATGYYPTILTSPDAVHWSGQTVPILNDLEGINFLNGAFWAVGSGGAIVTSADGTNWVQRSSPITRRLHDIGYGNGTYVVVGVKGNILRSTDGVTWSQVASGTPDRLEGITFANGVFVAAGESGTTLLSTNGLNWVEESAGFRRDWDGITAANNLVMAVGKSGMILTTSNGVDLVLRNAGTANDLHGVTFGGGKYVAVGDIRTVVTSTDAVHWQVRYSPTDPDLKNVTYGNGVYVAVGVAGSIFTSSDAFTWQPQPSGTTYDINDVTYGAGKFIAVSDDYYGGSNNGRVLSSPDGTNWLSQRLFSGKFPRAITFANNTFAIAGNDGYLSFSTNGTNWAVASTGIYRDGDNLRDVTFSHGVWVAVGNNGIILHSSDTVNWTRHYSPVIVNLHGVRYLDGRFVAIGNAGVVLQSELIQSRLSGVMRAAGFELTFHPGLGETHRIQSSTDLSGWIDFKTLNSPSDPTVVVDTSTTTNRAKFYRSVSP